MFKIIKLSSRGKGILLSLVFVLPILGCYAFLQIQKKRIKKEVKWSILHKLDDQQLVALSFAKDEIYQLKWEHDKEFEYEHQMYDVVRQKSNDDSITFYCYLDHAETQLNAEIDHLVKNLCGKSDPQKNTEQRLVDFFKSMGMPSYIGLSIVSCKLIRQTTFSFTQFALTPMIIPDFPPPRV